jgi:hypothetical protein
VLFFHILNCGPELTGIAEANTQQSFVDILDNDVIKSLRTLKVRSEHLLHSVHICSNHRTIWKESNDETRRRIEGDLKSSAAKYVDHAENTISKLQQAYLKKYSQPYAHSDVAPNKRFGNKVSSLFRRSQAQELAKSEDGIANIGHSFQLI